MTRRTKPYPPDGGLKAQVRPLGETFSVWDLIKRHFAPVAESDLPKLSPGKQSASDGGNAK